MKGLADQLNMEKEINIEIGMITLPDLIQRNTFHLKTANNIHRKKANIVR